jgi:hypothetical protein
MLVGMALDVGEGGRRSVGRPSKAQPYRRFIVELLLKHPKMKSLDVVREARAAGYRGGKSALYSLIASVRPRRSRPVGSQDRVPGEVSRHGFGQIDVQLSDGHTRTVTVLVSRLEYSGFTLASVVDDQGLESFTRALVAHFHQMGGVPLIASFDRSRPIALRTNDEGQVLEWDPTFAYTAVQLGVGVDVRARRGAERGPGTNLVNWLKHSFFAPRVISDLGQVAGELAQWLAAHNDAPRDEVEGGLQGEAPVVGLAEERQRLRPLRVQPDELALRFPIMVGPRALVVYDGHGYAVPSEAVGLVGVLKVFPTRIEIVAGRHEVEHPRLGATPGVIGVGKRVRPAVTMPEIPSLRSAF